VRRSIAVPAVSIALLGITVAGCGTGSSSSSSSGSTSTGGGGQAATVQAGPGVDVATKTITVGDINALTGPAAPLGDAVAAGHKAYFDALDARGGIDGWKVKLTVKDSGYNPQEHVQLYNELQPSVAILNSFGSPTTKAIQPEVDQQKIVTFPGSFDSLWGADPVMAPVGAPYSVDIANVLDYYTRSGAKKPKIGIIYQNDEYGADGLRGFKAAKSSLGFTDAGEESFNVGDTSFTAQVQKLKAAGAQAVVVTALPSATGPIVGTAATLGFKPQWILQGPAFLEQLITKDGNVSSSKTPVAGALTGALVTSFAAPWDDSKAPGMKQLVAAHNRYSAKLPPSIYFTLAYAQGQVQAAILRKAIQSGNLTRAGILAAKQNLGTVDLGGIAPNVSYAPEPGPPTRKSLIARIDPTVPGFLKAVAASHGSQTADSLKIG
jgi:ABC-type branched-subunit amino acid transport system substrate-binding protein